MFTRFVGYFFFSTIFLSNLFKVFFNFLFILKTNLRGDLITDVTPSFNVILYLNSILPRPSKIFLWFSINCSYQLKEFHLFLISIIYYNVNLKKFIDIFICITYIISINVVIILPICISNFKVILQPTFEALLFEGRIFYYLVFKTTLFTNHIPIIFPHSIHAEY